MSLIWRLVSNNPIYATGIVISCFVIDRSWEIGFDKFWKAQNRGVSEQINILSV